MKFPFAGVPFWVNILDPQPCSKRHPYPLRQLGARLSCFLRAMFLGLVKAGDSQSRVPLESLVFFLVPVKYQPNRGVQIPHREPPSKSSLVEGTPFGVVVKGRRKESHNLPLF